jgi:hypothetical protein
MLEAMMTNTWDGQFYIGERPNGVGVHQYLSYLVIKVGYQRIRATPSFEVLQWPTQVHPSRDGFLGHLLTKSNLLICFQNQA